MSFYPVQAQNFKLQGAGVAIGATTVKLTSFTQIDGTLLTMADFGSKGYLTVEPGVGNEEQISFTGITQNSDGTATLTGVSCVSMVSPYTEVSGFCAVHVGGTVAILTNTSGFYSQFPAKSNAESITGTWTFAVASYPRVDDSAVLPSADAMLATKKYVDGVAIAGAAISGTGTLGISRLSTAAVVATSPIVVGDNDTRVPTQGENDALVGTSGTPSSTNKYVTNDDTTGTGSVVRASVTNAIRKFGGDGSDGPLVVGTSTVINCNGSSVVVKNYSSISITGTGVLSFSNTNGSGTIVILKSQGDVAITSAASAAINLRGVGSNGGAGGDSVRSNATPTVGNSGSNGIEPKDYGNSGYTTGRYGTGAANQSSIDYGGGGGGGGAAYAAGTNGSSGTSNSGQVGVTGSAWAVLQSAMLLNSKYSGTKIAYLGAGGGGGSGGCANNASAFAQSSSATAGGTVASPDASTSSTVSSSTNGGCVGTGGGGGGAGGGAMLIECNGALNFTGTINASGGNGGGSGNATESGTSSQAVTGGGGAGGSGGVVVIAYNSLTANSGTVNVAGGTGGTAGTASGTSVSKSGGNGGNGGTGVSLVFQNTEVN